MDQLTGLPARSMTVVTDANGVRLVGLQHGIVTRALTVSTLPATSANRGRLAYATASANEWAGRVNDHLRREGYPPSPRNHHNAWL